MEIDFLEGFLRQIEDLRRSQVETASPVTTLQMTKLAGVSRATYYRFDLEAATAVRDIELNRHEESRTGQSYAHVFFETSMSPRLRKVQIRSKPDLALKYILSYAHFWVVKRWSSH